MFDFHGFVLKTIKGMIDNYPDWQVSEYALGWYSKGKLTEEDLAEIDELINIHNAPVERNTESETDSTDEIV